MEQQRKSRRLQLLAEVKIKPHSGSPWVQAVLMNINGGGIGVYAQQPLRKKEKVTIKISYLERSKSRDVEEIPGEVCWVHPVADQFAAGIKFTQEVNSRNFPLLSECLEYAKNKE